MSLSIDTSKLKLKYILHIHKECAEYPTDEDYLYELITALENENLTDSLFGTIYARHKMYYLPKLEERTYEKHFEYLQKFESQGYLQIVEPGNMKSVKYKLINHPWIATDFT